MKINIISIGHKPPTWAEEGCKEYLKRFQRDLSIVLTELKPAFRVSDTDKNHLARAKEKGRILTKLNKNARLIALDEAGTQTTTNELARLLTNWMAEEEIWISLLGVPMVLILKLKIKLTKCYPYP